METSRRGFLGGIALGTIAASLGRAEGAPARRPNVVVILTDDQGYGDIHSHGNDRIDTPNLDALAASGARFQRFYVSPLCAPTRASFLTGRYYPRTGVHGVSGGAETMRSEEVTIAEVLKAAGYATACFGKWHNGAHYPHHPLGQGFDEYLGVCCGHWNNYFDIVMDHNGKPEQTRGYVTDVLTDAALDFIERNRQKPFFVYLPYNTPHSPMQVPDKYFDKYVARGLDPRTACIYGMCECIDYNVGRLLARLDALGLGDETIVVFFTDNGPNGPRYNAGMRGAKGSVHEGGVRVPCFVRWRGHIEPGTVIEQIAADIDLLPTIAEMTGAPLPEGVKLDGVSLVPLLTGQAKQWPERMIFTFHKNRGAVRTQRYRLTLEGRRVALFDMEADPGQKRDIARHKPDVFHKLKAAYEAMRRDVMKGQRGTLPIPVGYPQMPLVEIPTPEGKWSGGLRFGGRFANNNWLTGWTSTEAEVHWDLEVVHEGPYEVSLLYICPGDDLGSRIRVEADGQRAEAVLDKAQEPNFVPSPDRVPRKEVYERRWGQFRVGTLRLKKGRQTLSVRAVEMPGKAAMDLKAIRLRRLD